MIEDEIEQNHKMAQQSQPAAKKGKADPRTPDFVIKYDKTNFSKGDQDSGAAEFYQLISVVFGMLAFVSRQKQACWLGLFFYFTSSINTRSDARLQHILTGISIVLISFVNIYLSPQKPGMIPQAAQSTPPPDM